MAITIGVHLRFTMNRLKACLEMGGTGYQRYQPVFGGNLPPKPRQAGSPPQQASGPRPLN